MASWIVYLFCLDGSSFGMPRHYIPALHYTYSHFFFWVNHPKLRCVAHWVHDKIGTTAFDNCSIHLQSRFGNFSGKLPEYRFPAGPGAATGVPNRDLKSRYHFTDIFEASKRSFYRKITPQPRTRQFTGIFDRTDYSALCRKSR